MNNLLVSGGLNCYKVERVLYRDTTRKFVSSESLILWHWMFLFVLKSSKCCLNFILYWWILQYVNFSIVVTLCVIQQIIYLLCESFSYHLTKHVFRRLSFYIYVNLLRKRSLKSSNGEWERVRRGEFEGPGVVIRLFKTP